MSDSQHFCCNAIVSALNVMVEDDCTCVVRGVLWGMPRQVMTWHVIACHVMSCHVMSCHGNSSCHAKLIISCHVMATCHMTEECACTGGWRGKAAVASDAHVWPKKRDCLHKSAAFYPILAQGDAQFVLHNLLGTFYESVWLWVSMALWNGTSSAWALCLQWTVACR